MLKVALVVFCKEKDKPRFVVNISDIKNFKPRSLEDFDPKKVYKVRWPLVKAKDSKSPDSISYYDANILIIAASAHTMISLAKKKNIRLPRGYKDQKSAKAEVGDDVQKGRIYSKRSRRAVEMAMERSSKERRNMILQSNITDIFTNTSKDSASKRDMILQSNIIDVVPGSSMNSASKNEPVQESLVIESKEKDDKECDLSALGVQTGVSLPKRANVCRNIDFGGLPGKTMANMVAVSPRKRTSDSMIGSCSSSPSKRHQGNGSIDDKENSIFKQDDLKTGNNESTPVKDPAEALDLSKSQTSPTSTIVCSPATSEPGAFVRSPAVLKRQRAFYITPDGTDLVAEVHKVIEDRRQAESSNNSKENLDVKEPKISKSEEKDVIPSRAISIPEERECDVVRSGSPDMKLLNGAPAVTDTIKTRTRSKSKLKTDGDEDSDVTSCSYVSSSSQLAMLNEKIVDLQNKLNKERKTVRILKTELYSAQDKLAKMKKLFSEDITDDTEESLKEPTPVYTPVKVNNCTWETSPLKPVATLEVEYNTPKKLSPVKKSSSKNSSAGKLPVPRNVLKARSSSEKKSMSSQKSPKTHKLKSKKESSGTYQDHRVIGKMIYDALLGEVPLQSNGAGKVHLGNNIWIKETSWNKLSTSRNPLLTTVKNLTETVWGWETCAAYSLSGGTGPKTPGAKPKEAAPRAGVQAILGFYRAKLMQQGLQIGEVLDNNVEKMGLQSIKEKFHYCHKKYVREMAKANQFADGLMDNAESENK